MIGLAKKKIICKSMFSNSLKSRPTSFCFRRKTVDPKPHILNVINCLQIRHDNLFRPWSSDVSYFACRNNLMTWLVGEIYTSEATGNDETGDGSQEKPFKTILRVSHSIIKLSTSMVDKNKFLNYKCPLSPHFSFHRQWNMQNRNLSLLFMWTVRRKMRSVYIV